MSDNLRAGAPFDEDNIFNIPPTDGGLIVNPHPFSFFVNIDAGTFISPIKVDIDGGKIPLAGTATYDPTKTYTENDIYTGPNKPYIIDSTDAGVET